VLIEIFILKVYRKATIPLADDECLGSRIFQMYPTQSEIIETIKRKNGNNATVTKEYEWIEEEK
jgi:hypothetical protein